MGSATLLVAVLFTLPAGAADRESKAMFLRHWQVAKEFTLAVAEAMPPDGYDFRPKPEQLTFGRLMTHIGAQNSDSCASAAATTALPQPRVNDKPTALRYLAETFDKCAKDLEALSPERWDLEVYKFQGQPVLGREALWYTFTHMAHHRGQAEVYLRLKNITPPAWRF